MFVSLQRQSTKRMEKKRKECDKDNRRAFVAVVCLMAFSLSMLSCGGKGVRRSDADADTLTMRYARNIALVNHTGYTEAIIYNPWQEGSILSRYEIRKPLTHSAIFIASVASLVEELGELASIGGVCEPEYIANPNLLSAIGDGRIRDLGSAMTPSRERIIDLAPDAILLSPFQNVGNYGNIEQLGIPIIPCADYMERSALARAEWMRFYGRLFGCGERADSLFDALEARYYRIKNTRAEESQSTEAPTVFFDGRNGSAWYMPGGQSTLGQLVADAGGRYIFASNEQSGSVPFSFEQVYDRCRDADIWLYRYNAPRRLTLDLLRSEYEPYSRFCAFKEGNVFGCNNAENIFFEEYPFHPDLLLNDFVRIFAGEADSLRYFHRL